MPGLSWARTKAALLRLWRNAGVGKMAVIFPAGTECAVSAVRRLKLPAAV